MTGKAGTGKSTLLRYLVEHAEKNVVILAPTGIAALSIGGETIHSFCRFPPEPITEEKAHVLRTRDLIRQVNVVIVDEVSMVRADLLDGIDMSLKKNRGNSVEPFGGVQVILFGDAFQLPPVVASKEEALFFSSVYKSPYFFDANSFVEGYFETINLEKVFRQKDADFIELLDSIRVRRYSALNLQKTNARVISNLPESRAEKDI